MRVAVVVLATAGLYVAVVLIAARVCGFNRRRAPAAKAIPRQLDGPPAD